ncbi:MAG: glycerophosphodiester phosphodiesterase [Tissierellia bacterium]|nr:glycerophosphodiester phosphodiesterase [Tissierellia bacterium]
MLNIAHRGFKSKYPENTMIAFRKAVEAGCDGIEFDVHLSKDGEVVIIHDERLDRTTDRTGKVMDYTWRELQEINGANLYPHLSFEPIPTLRQYFDYIKDKNIITNVELKTSIYWYDKIEEKVYNILKEYDIMDQIIISSFNHKSLMEMKKLDKNIVCGALVESWLWEPWNYLKELGVEYYHPNAYGVDQELVDNLHKHGFGINVWYGKEPYDFEKTYALDVDGMITDYPDIIKRL